MKDYPILRNAPIVETIVDIQAKISSECDINKLQNMYDFIKEQYPNRYENIVGDFQVDLKKVETSIQPNIRPSGYRYSSVDEKQIVQTKLDGFTFHRLHPYEGWGNLRDEAKRLWAIYLNMADPELISRLALRYINNIKLPISVDLDDYFTAPPSVPKGLPQELSGFFYRIAIYNKQLDAKAIITQALEPTIFAEVKEVQIILDVDVFIYRHDGINVENVWDEIERLRDFKNKIFFSSITDKLKEMYS
ncbi:MAG: TIGR04255 family protein [Nitrospirae bacterium]|nr:TIGR04255 family protein [Nitrospirota bacterium]